MVFHAAYGYSGFDEPGSTRRKAIVCSFKIAVTSIAAFAAISVTGSVSRADTRSGFFIADAGATSVRYLFMNDNRDAVSSYLEAILPSAEAPDGLRRVKLLGKRTGESFFFGPYLAVRDGDGYTLTTIKRGRAYFATAFLAHRRVTARARAASLRLIGSSTDR
jgi:hypothetical protein